jgi:hypothetical protein
MVPRPAAVQAVEAALLQSGRLVEGRPCAQCGGDYPTFIDVEQPICVACLTESSGLPFRTAEAEENAKGPAPAGS